jgi:hypothetical protein
VRAFLRRTVEGCQRLLALDHAYNLRASVHRGVAIAAAGDADMASLKASYDFMKNSNFSAMMSPAQTSRRPVHGALRHRRWSICRWDYRFLRRQLSPT